MTWATKNLDWKKLVLEIQKEIDANSRIIPNDRIEWIQHYLDHDEYAMSFEFLYLEVMEREGAICSLGKKKAEEVGRLLDLDKETHYDNDFWKKFMEFLSRLK